MVAVGARASIHNALTTTRDGAGFGAARLDLSLGVTVRSPSAKSVAKHGSHVVRSSALWKEVMVVWKKGV